MNERIRELAEQAGIAVWGDAVHMYHPSDTLDATVLAKFTELIVRECANACESHDIESFGILPIRAFMVTKSCQNNIKEHFGVKS